MRHEAPKSRAVFVHGTDIKAAADEHFAAFEERRSSAVAGVAYPTSNSRSAAACGRAIDTAVSCFLERPSDSDTAMSMIGQFVDEGIAKLQETDKEFRCSLAMLYIFKGRARVYPAGHAAVLFFEEGVHKNTWYGDGRPTGCSNRSYDDLPEKLELEKDCRFIFIAGADTETVKAAAKVCEDCNGEDTEKIRDHMSDKHLAWVDLYLPERKKGIIRGLGI